MIDNKFSAEKFERAGYGTPKARALAKKLQIAIQKELDLALRPAFYEVKEKLNSMGHNLKLRRHAKPGDVCFIEPNSKPQRGSEYKFLVGLDVVVTVGYPETVDNPYKFKIGVKKKSIREKRK